MVPSDGMLTDSTEGIIEMRFLIKVSGVKTILRYDDDGSGSEFREAFLASGLANEVLSLRTLFGLVTDFRLDFDTATALEILEIDIGMIGTH